MTSFLACIFTNSLAYSYYFHNIDILLHTFAISKDTFNNRYIHDLNTLAVSKLNSNQTVTLTQNGRLTKQNGCPFYSKAAAPEMISISSRVITAWRVLLKVRVSFSIISPAFLEALSMAVIRDDCSEHAPSLRA